MKTIQIPNSIKAISACAVASLVFSAITPLQAQQDLLAKNKADLEVRISQNRARLDQRQIDPAKAIPAAVLAAAKGVVILNQVKAGLVIGAEVGNGVVILKDAQGNWGPPAFVTIGKGSFGFQIGASETISFFILMTDESLKLVRGGGAGGIGVSLKAAVGPLGAGGDIGSASLRKPVLVYSNVKGAFAGASIDTGGLIGSEKRNQVAYDGMNMEQILFSGNAVITPAGKLLGDALSFYSGKPVPVQ